MSETITVEMIDELFRNGYIVSTGLGKVCTPWWSSSAGVVNNIETFTEAAHAAWEHYQASKRPAKPEYKSGWVEYNGYGYKVQDVWMNKTRSTWFVTATDGKNFVSTSASEVRECPPRQTPQAGWELTGEVKDKYKKGEYWIAYNGLIGEGDIGCDKEWYSGLRWAVREIKPSVYTIDTFPKGEVWVRLKNCGLRELVTGVSLIGVFSNGDCFSYAELAESYELSTDGGITWRPARPE